MSASIPTSIPDTALLNPVLSPTPLKTRDENLAFVWRNRAFIIGATPSQGNTASAGRPTRNARSGSSALSHEVLAKLLADLTSFKDCLEAMLNDAWHDNMISHDCYLTVEYLLQHLAIQCLNLRAFIDLVISQGDFTLQYLILGYCLVDRWVKELIGAVEEQESQSFMGFSFEKSVLIGPVDWAMDVRIV